MSGDPREAVIEELSRVMPPVMRWAGTLAKSLRRYDIALAGKSSGNANTDALTLADLTVQELLVGALRDADPVVRTCRIEAEEVTGDLHIFQQEGPLVLSLDPIDGTKQFRDRSGNGYAIMLHLRDRQTVLYSLVYLPEAIPGSDGAAAEWVEVRDHIVRCGPDDLSLPAGIALQHIAARQVERQRQARGIYLIGFQQHDQDRAKDVSGTGLEGYAPDEMPGSIYPLMATGKFAGSLIHTPNVYDFPVSLHIARAAGGDAIWVHNRQPVSFETMWLDERADMLRLPGIVACSAHRDVLDTLCTLAADWHPDRYTD
jgi:3'(2'), 5'-bisphosphate nucleotidase